MSPDPRELRDCFGRFATGVTVVTCVGEDDRAHGATVNAFTVVSLDPPLVQVTLTKTSKAGQYLEGKPFAVNVLAEDQLEVALHFAGHPQEREPLWAEGATAPVLQGATTVISCQPWRIYDGGDHVIVIGAVADIDVTTRDPLLFFGGQFHELGPTSAGSPWLETLDSPSSGWYSNTDASHLLLSGTLPRPDH